MAQESNRVLSPEIDVWTSPLPFSNLRRKSVAQEGDSISDIVSQVPAGYSANVSINGVEIPKDKWHVVRPKIGTCVNVRVVPMGGGGEKNILGTILTLAVVVAAPYAAGFVAAAGTVGFAAATAVFGVAGSLLVSAIAPPSSPKLNSRAASQDSPTLFIQGARNQVRPFGVIPIVLGRHRIVPPLAAKTITETRGDNQYVRQLFCWGYGELEVENIKIGDTPIDQFDDVEFETVFTKGAAPDFTLFPSAADQTDLSIVLDTNYTVRTSPASITELSVDITFPNGLVEFAANGSKRSRTVDIEVQVSPAGANDWSAPADAFKAISAQTVTTASTPRGLSGSQEITNRFRRDAVTIREFDGSARIIKGRVVSSPSAVVTPSVPEGERLLGTVFATTSGAQSVNDLSGELVGTVTEASGDFALSLTGNTVNIASGSISFKGFSVTARQTNAVRRSVRFPVAEGQYDVRLRRLVAESNETAVTDSVAWTAIRSFKKVDPILKPNIQATAVRMRATDQLNGAIDTLSAECSSIIPDWDGSAWIDRATNNPASIFRYIYINSDKFDGILGANENPLSASDLDMSAIQDWHDFCESNDFSFNAVIDFETSVDSLIRDVCAAGRASPTIVDGKRSVVIDRKKTDVIQHVTPRNSWGYSIEKSFPEIPDGFRVQFVNEAAEYIQDEILVFDDGFNETNAKKFARLELFGVTNADQAYKLGREHIATLRLRPETHVFNMDVEHLVATRGDLIRLTHDVPLIGLGYGRIKSVADDGTNATSVILDDQVEMQSGKEYSVRFRLDDGTTLIKPVDTVVGATSTLTFTNPFPIASAPADGDIYMFGESGKESVELVIKSIEPRSDMTAEIRAVDHSPDIFEASTGLIPDFETNITLPPELQRPHAPVIKDIQTGENVQEAQLDGSITTRMVITLENNNEQEVEVNAQIKAADENQFFQADILSANPDRVVIGNLENGQTYDVKLRYRTRGAGVSSPAHIENNVFFVGTSGLPPDVEDLDITVRGENVYLSWDKVSVIDLDGYRVRFSPKTSGATWASSIPLEPNLGKEATGGSFPSLVGTYLVKAIDRAGNLSENAVTAVSTIGDIAELNVIKTIDEDAAYAGAKSHVVVISGQLQLDSADTVDEWAVIDDVDSWDAGVAGLVSEGIYSFENTEDLGEVLTSVLSADIDLVGANVLDDIDKWGMVDDREDWEGDVASKFGFSLQVRTTNDDPAGTPTWGAWRKFVIGEYTARAFQFRAVLKSFEQNVTALVNNLDVRIDVPDRVESGNDITVPIGGQTVTFTNAFRETPAVGLAIDNLNKQESYEITNRTKSGFDIEFFDPNDISTSKTFSYVAKGFGKVLVV